MSPIINRLFYKSTNTNPRNAGERGAIAVPAVLWLLGVPFTIVLLLWLLFFRG